jgi:DNA-binding transcriptional MerR regulator
LYKKKDLDHILRIKQLLYEEGYTISGAKKKMSGSQGRDVEDVIETAKKELREILEILK